MKEQFGITLQDDNGHHRIPPLIKNGNSMMDAVKHWDRLKQELVPLENYYITVYEVIDGIPHARMDLKPR